MNDFQKTNGRTKRFIHQLLTQQVFEIPEDSTEPLTLSYTLDAEKIGEKEKKAFRKIIAFATHSLNRLGFIKVEPATKALGNHPREVIFNLRDFRKRYGNHIKIFLKKNISNSVCITFPSYKLNIFLSQVMTLEEGIDTFPLAALYTIECDYKKLLEKFKQYAPGILVHEIMHTLGISHAQNALVVNTNSTQNILVNKLPSSVWESDEIKEQRYLKLFGKFDGDAFPAGIDYDVASPFSIMHYRPEILAPEIFFNKTSIRDLLISGGLSQTLINDYFELFEKYVGYPLLLTHQDILSFATRVWQIAPLSLTKYYGLESPRFLFIDGVFMTSGDRLKWRNVLNAIIEVTKFNYPILHKPNVTIVLPLGESSINLIEKANLVSLDGPVYCAQDTSNFSAESMQVNLEKNCLLKTNINNFFFSSLEIAVYNTYRNSTMGVNLFFADGQISYSKGVEMSVQKPPFPNCSCSEQATNGYSTSAINTDVLHLVRLGKTEVQQSLPSGFSVLELIQSCEATPISDEQIKCDLIGSSNPELVRVSEDCLLSAEMAQSVETIQANVTFYTKQPDEENCYLTLTNNHESNTTKRGRRSINAYSMEAGHYLAEKNDLRLNTLKLTPNTNASINDASIRMSKAGSVRFYLSQQQHLEDMAHHYLEGYDRKVSKRKNILNKGLNKSNKNNKKNAQEFAHIANKTSIPFIDQKQTQPQVENNTNFSDKNALTSRKKDFAQVFVKRQEKIKKSKNIGFYAEFSATKKNWTPTPNLPKQNAFLSQQSNFAKPQMASVAMQRPLVGYTYHEKIEKKSFISKLTLSAGNNAHSLRQAPSFYHKGLRDSRNITPLDITGTLFALNILARTLTGNKFTARTLPKKIQKGMNHSQKIRLTPRDLK